MSNDYYVRSTNYVKGTTARGDSIEGSLDSVEAGFDLLPSVSEMSSGLTTYEIATGTANTYAITMTGVSAYTEGMKVSIKINITNTGASTLNINAMGVIAIKRADITDVSEGELVATAIATIAYNGTYFILTSGSTGSAASKVAAAESEASAVASAASASLSSSSASSSGTSATAAAASAAAAAVSETNAADSAAGVNLPSVVSSDAGKILQVNAGATGYTHVAFNTKLHFLANS